MNVCVCVCVSFWMGSPVISASHSVIAGRVEGERGAEKEILTRKIYCKSGALHQSLCYCKTFLCLNICLLWDFQLPLVDEISWIMIC